MGKRWTEGREYVKEETGTRTERERQTDRERERDRWKERQKERQKQTKKGKGKEIVSLRFARCLRETVVEGKHGHCSQKRWSHKRQQKVTFISDGSKRIFAARPQ